MKLKYFLRGLASGIVVTTLLLTISHNAKKDNISEQEIIERAEKLGMVMEEETDLLSAALTPKGEPTAEPTAVPESTGEAQTASQITGEPTKGAEMELTQKPTQEPVLTQEPVPTQEPTKEPTQIPTEEPVSSEKKVLTIVSGMWSDKVASELQAMGLVESASEFDQYLISNGYADKIVVGTFEIPAGASYDEIARIITSK